MTLKIICRVEYIYVEILSCEISAAVVAGQEISLTIMTYEFDYP